MRRFSALLVLAAALVALGMTTRDASEVPIPEKSFSVTITDREGITTQASKVSVEGDVYLTVLRGQAKVYVPFQKIDRIDFGEMDGSMVDATLLLRTGEKVDVRIRRNLRAYGVSGIGNFSLRLEAVAQVQFEMPSE